MKKEDLLLLITTLIIVIVIVFNFRAELIKDIQTGEAAKVKAAEAATTGPITHLKFDEGQGERIFDSVGNTNSGYLYGIAWTTDCISGTCLDFNGIYSFVDLGGKGYNNLFLTTQTIMFWFKADEITDTTGLYGIVMGEPTPNDYYIWFKNGELLYTIRNNVNNVVSISAPVNPGQWYYITAVYDANARGQTPSMYLYLNGNLIGSTKQTNLKITDVFPKAIRLGLGFVDETTGTEGYYDGVIDELRVYDRALTAEEIKQHYESER